MWPVIVIASLWFIFSSPYFLKGLVPLPTTYLATFFSPWSATYGMPVKNNAMPDIITQIYPWKKLTIETWKSGHIPLWNPYSFSGTAHAGNYQSAVFSPFNLLFFVLPFIDSWSILVLLQPLLAGLCMFACITGMGKSKQAALLSSIAFMFCGFMVVWMGYATLGYAILWLPLIFWGINTYWNTSSRLSIIAIVGGIALSFAAGHFQMSLYVLSASFLYILWTTLVRRQWLKGFVLLGYLMAGVFISMPQILLSLHAYQDSLRSAGVAKGEVIPWAYLTTFIAPDFFGNPVTRNDWFGHYAEWAGFIGVAPLLLALYACFSKTVTKKWFYVVMAVVSLAFALPTPLNELLYVLKVPVLSGSAASRIIILTSFSLAVLAAFGFDAIYESWRKKRYKQIIYFIIGCAIVLGLVWAVLLLGKTLPVDKLSIAKRNFVIPSLLTITVCILFLCGLIQKKIIQVLIVVLLVGITSFDTLRFAAKWMPFESRIYVYPQVKSLSFLQSHIGNNRVFGNIGNEVGGMFSLPLIEGYDAVYQDRYGKFMNAASTGQVASQGRSVVQFDKHGKYKTEVLQLLGVRYIYHKLSDGRNVWVFPYWEYLGDGSMIQIYHDELFEILEYKNAYPRTFLASSYVLASNDQDIIAKLFAKDFDRRETLILEEKPSLDPQVGSGSAQIVAYEPNTVTIKTQSQTPKLLFLSDVYDAGWKATVDGKPSHIYRADYDFRALGIPKGEHVVIFRYQPPEFFWGMIGSIVGLCIAVAGLIRRRP